jgi:hypothetical protein
MALTMPDRAPRAGVPLAPWRANAFGIAIEGDFDAPGLPPATEPLAGPATRVEVVRPDEIDSRWDSSAATRLLEERFDDAEEPARSIDHVPGAGYRLYARHFGLALVSDDGRRILCAPPEDEPWSWQRFLVGRILPWAAVLCGREIFHASAVAADGRAIALVGVSGAGKSSLAAHLVLGGAEFLTDDVLAVDNADAGMPRAHPGVGILCMRHAEHAAMPAGRWDALGSVLGDSGKLYVEVPRAPSPRPLGAMYFVTRVASAQPPITPVDEPLFGLLVGSTFNESLQSPRRLRQQFELCADIAEHVPLFRLRIAPGVSAAELAETVRAHARTVAAGRPR